MRKLKLQMQITVDGFVSTGPNDEQKWVTWALDEIKPVVLELLNGADTIIIGRKLAVDYIPYWEGVVTDPKDPMYEIGKYIVNVKKVVFSKTLDKSRWSNTDLVKGNLAEEINNLKRQNGKDILVYGGSSFVSALVKERLIDEFNFFLNPVAIGKGDGIFGGLDNFQQLKLTNSIVYPSGIVLLQYVPVNA